MARRKLRNAVIGLAVLTAAGLGGAFLHPAVRARLLMKWVRSSDVAVHPDSIALGPTARRFADVGGAALPVALEYARLESASDDGIAYRALAVAIALEQREPRTNRLHAEGVAAIVLGLEIPIEPPRPGEKERKVGPRDELRLVCVSAIRAPHEVRAFEALLEHAASFAVAPWQPDIRELGGTRDGLAELLGEVEKPNGPTGSFPFVALVNVLDPRNWDGYGQLQPPTWRRGGPDGPGARTLREWFARNRDSFPRQITAPR